MRIWQGRAGRGEEYASRGVTSPDQVYLQATIGLVVPGKKGESLKRKMEAGSSGSGGQVGREET